MAENKTITTPPVRVSYPQVFEAKSVNGSDPRYSVTIMFDKKNSKHMECLKRLGTDLEKALVEKWPNEAKRPRIPVAGHDKSPIKDADKNCDGQGIPICEKNPEYAGHWVVRCSSKSRPAVVDRDRADILDKSAVYGGCFCCVNVNAYAFDMPENKGVTVGLNGVMLWADGDSFAGRPSKEAMFGSVKDDSDDEANYGTEKKSSLPF
jgi:hypothetical protein